MKTKLPSLILIVILVSSGLFFYLQSYSKAASGFSCEVAGFEASVHQGPSAGWGVVGRLVYTVAENGELTGTLTTDDNSLTLPVIGQMNGHAISLAFDLGQAEDADYHLYIYGTGVSISNAGDCTGLLGGGLVGPMSGDSGDWGTCDPSGPRLPLCKPTGEQ